MEVNKILPAGYEFVGFRPPETGELFLSTELKTCINDHSVNARVIVRKSAPFEVGDLIRDPDGKHAVVLRVAHDRIYAVLHALFPVMSTMEIHESAFGEYTVVEHV